MNVTYKCNEIKRYGLLSPIHAVEDCICKYQGISNIYTICGDEEMFDITIDIRLLNLAISKYQHLANCGVYPYAKARKLPKVAEDYMVKIHNRETIKNGFSEKR